MTTGLAQSISFRVTAPMVEMFAHLTGDRSSLHTDEEFARRSIFRDRVAHGMLPVSFLSLLPCLLPENRSSALRSLSAKFVQPCFIGDHLTLTARITPRTDDLDLDYTIVNTATSRELTFGTATFAIQNPRESSQKSGPGPLITSPTERSLAFDQISKGDQSTFRFRITTESCGLLHRILQMGELRGAEFPQLRDWERSSDGGGFLANSMLSTYVGMRMPGRTATFTDFMTAFRQPISFDQTYELQGQVTFKSRSAPFLTQAVSISLEGDENPALQAKIHVRVNAPPASLKSAQQLQENDMDLGLKGKVALVTGASRGTGAAIAKLLSLHGVKVAINFLKSETEAQAVLDDIRSAGGSAVLARADVSDQEQVQRMIMMIESTYGPVEILVNNAIGDAFAHSFLDLKWADMQRDLDIIVKGAFNCCQAVLPSMVKMGFGRIINISSSYVEMPPMNQTKYVAAKSALVGMTRSLAIEFAPHQIHANLIVPSLMRTDLSQAVPDEVFAATQRSTPLGRLAAPEDVAKTVLYLASSWSSYTTGQKVMVTGGAAPYL